MVASAVVLISWVAWFWLPIVPFECVYYRDLGPRVSCWNRAPVQSVDQAARICAVLDRYGELWWHLSDRVILISPSLAFDSDLLSNYTKKAG